MVHARRAVPIVDRRRIRPALAVAFVCAAGTTGCHRAAVRSEAVAPLVDIDAWTAGGPARPTLVARPSSSDPRPAAPSDRIAPLWAEAPVVREREYEVQVGLGAGIAFPGQQDLKFKRKDAAGDLIDNLFTHDVTEHPSAVASVDVEVWKTRGFLADFGLRASLLRWSTRVKANTFQNGLPGGGTSPVAPFDTVDEDRLGFYLNLERRFWIAPGGRPAVDAAYAYVGLGAGYVRSELTHGSTRWGTSADAFAGVSVPLADRWRLRLEGLYVATRDVDISGANLSWEVESSGTATHVAHGHHFSHLDTRFLVAMIGVEYRL